MYRISKRQQEGNIYLQELDNYLYAGVTEIKNDKIIFTKQLQKMFITENFSRFSDIVSSMEDLKKLDEITVVVIDSTKKEEKEVTIEIEGGI